MRDVFEHRWVPLRHVLAYLPEMEAKGVSEVARSPRGFLEEYKRQRTAENMKTTLVDRTASNTYTWAKRRMEFIARHLPQYRAHPTRRRWLALMAWAYRA